MCWKQFAVAMASAAIAAAWAPPAAAQATVNTGSVSGRVFDAQGAVVPGAQVVAHQLETNLTTEAITDATGRFRFALLRVGPYEITARLQGFDDATERVTLGAASAFDLALTLSLASLNTS